MALVVAWLILIPAGLAHAQIDASSDLTASSSQAPANDDGHPTGGEAVHCAAHCNGHSPAAPIAALEKTTADPALTSYAVATDDRILGREDEPPTKPPAA